MDKRIQDVPGAVHFDGAMATKGYALNKMMHSFNSAAGREAFRTDPEAVMTQFGLSEPQKAAIRARDIPAIMEEGASIYYVAKLAGVLGLSVQNLGGMLTGRTTEEFQAYLASQEVGKPHG